MDFPWNLTVGLAKVPRILRSGLKCLSAESIARAAFRAEFFRVGVPSIIDRVSIVAVAGDGRARRGMAGRQADGRREGEENWNEAVAAGGGAHGLKDWGGA